MENNEITKVVEDETQIEDIVVREDSGIGTGAAIAIGACLACAVGAAVKGAQWLIGRFKAKKELRAPENEIEVTDEDIEEIVTK